MEKKMENEIKTGIMGVSDDNGWFRVLDSSPIPIIKCNVMMSKSHEFRGT